MATTELTAMDVANRIRPYVTKKTVGDITLWLDEASIRLQNGYWRIHIRPSREPEPLFPYFEALADLQEELQENEGLKITISSGDPLIEYDTEEEDKIEPSIRNKKEYAVIYERGKDGEEIWSAYVPDLPGVSATGATMAEVQKNIREAIALHIQSMIEHGATVPEPKSITGMVEIAA